MMRGGGYGSRKFRSGRARDLLVYCNVLTQLPC